MDEEFVKDEEHPTEPSLEEKLKTRFASVFDGETYRSTLLTAENLTTEGDGENTDGPVITIREGQTVLRERITDHIAIDINVGNLDVPESLQRYDATYWYFYEDENAEVQWVPISGSVRVENGQLILSYTDILTGEDVEVTIYREKNPAVTDPTGLSEKERNNTYIRFPVFDSDNNVSYLVAGSDATVKADGKDIITQRFAEVEDGTDYEVGKISAEEGNVTITLKDGEGSLLNDKEADDPDPVNVKGENVDIYAKGGESSIGTEEKPLIIEAKNINFYDYDDPDGEQHITKDTYIVSEGDAPELADKLIVDGVIFDLRTEDGSVNAPNTSLEVINGGEARFTTNTDEDAESDGDVTLKDILVDGDRADGETSVLIVDADGTFTTDRILAEDGAELDVSAGEDVIVNKIRTLDSDTVFNAGEDMRFEDWLSEKSNNEIIAGGTVGHVDDEKQAMIKYADSDTDSDASLAISGGSVGTEKTPLVVDVPENFTVLLPNVGDTFLETPVVTIVREDSGKIVPVWIDESDLLYENYAAVAEELGQDYVGVDPTTGEAIEEGKTLRHITDMLTTVDVGTIELTEDEIEGLGEDEIKALTEKKVEEKVAELLDELCAQAILDNGIPGAAATVDNSSRNVNIKVGTSTGETSVNNKGAISITVEGDSDLTVDKIISEGGDVTIDVQNGSLLAAEDGDSRIDATNVELSATENIGSEEQSVQVNERSVDTVVGARVLDQTGDGTGTTGRIDSYTTTDENGNEITVYTVDVAIGYDWVMDADNAAAARIDAEAKGENGSEGNVYLDEVSGDIGLGVISGEGTVELKAPGDAIDVRTEDEKNSNTPNIAAENAAVTLGGELGSEEDPIAVEIEDHMTVSAEDDINLTTKSDLDVTADSQNGEVNVAGEKNVSVDNTELSHGGTGDMLVGEITSGGDVEVSAEGDMVPAEESLISGDNVTVTAGGSIGSEDSPMAIDTASGSNGEGTLTAESGDDAYIDEQSGDLVIDSAEVGGDAVITAPGSVTDSNGSTLTEEATEAQKKADDADNRANAAEDRADVLDKYADRLEDESKAADEAAKAAEDAADAIADEIKDILDSDPTADVSELEEEYEEAKKAAEELRDAADEAKKKAEEARAEADTAADEAEKLREAADEAQQKADEALEKAEKAEPAVKTGGDLTIEAGGSVGESGNALDTEVGGKTNVVSGGELVISEKGDMDLGEVVKPEDTDVQLGSTGSITSESEIIGKALDVNALDGSAELKTDVDSVNGTVSDDLTLNNKGALEIDDLSVGGKATINAGGNVTAGDVEDGTANVSAEELVIRTNSKSDIGEEDKPLIVDTDRITASGDDIYIESLGDLTIDEIRGDDVNVNAGGEVDAGKSNVNVRANDLTINAEGDIGDPDNKLIIYVPGNVDINSELGGVWYINLYEGGGTAFDNLVTDEAMNPKPYVRADLTSVRAEDGTVALRTADGSISLTLRDGKQLPKTNGKVLYIGALTDDLADITGEVRILHLTRERVEDLRSMGYEWIVFRVGNAYVLIHLTELEEGDYLITLASGRTGSELKVNFNGADLEDIPGYITLADISETVS